VLDNLSTHSVGALYQIFPANEARRVLRRLEFHYVPKHASWLNMVEIEIGVLACQCLDRRIESFTRLVAETAASSKQGMKAELRESSRPGTCIVSLNPRSAGSRPPLLSVALLATPRQVPSPRGGATRLASTRRPKA
jgi:DDE superfamily endonuclease